MEEYADDLSSNNTDALILALPSSWEIHKSVLEELEGAAREGDINKLYELIRRDPYLLDRIDAIPFVDTPMHIAASSDNASFTMEMMRLKPSFSLKQNQDGFTPMHLALKNWRTRILHRLIETDCELVRVKGKEGKTLLHCAVERENQSKSLKILDYILSACPQSIEDVTIYKETALHIAVKRENFDVFECLVKRILRAKHKNSDIQEKQILNGKNGEGNTVLHIAALKNAPKIVEALIKCGVDANVKNSKGDTALNISESQDPLLEGNIQVRHMLLKVTNASLSSSASTNPDDDEELTSPTASLKISINRYKANMSNDVRNILLIVAVLIAMATYHTAAVASVGLGQHNHVAASASSMGGGGSTLSTDFWIFNIGALLTSSLVIYFLFPRGYISILLLLSLCLYSLTCYSLSPISIVFPGISVIASILFVIVKAIWNLVVESATERLIRSIFSS
ncbi:ankyrin repeat-containing protein BDA1-like [Humulus lupulus]|uniref:ankyrin repeat-containing protein BDA1-like n=1 Tax=Humulus lupulus TaxID=3486 RepID=UPI002B40973B|nr:ankyrin repeat-containing protein BDA1-like [Humulus lupulus]